MPVLRRFECHVYSRWQKYSCYDERGFITRQILSSENSCLQISFPLVQYSLTHACTLKEKLNTRAHVISCKHICYHSPVCRGWCNNSPHVYMNCHTFRGSGIFTQTDALPWPDASWLAKHSGVIGLMLDPPSASPAYLHRDWLLHYAWHSDTDLTVLLQLWSSYLLLFLSDNK